MSHSNTSWENTTHNWAAIVDHEHLAQIREQPATYALGGVEHLVLEVLAYAADATEAAGGAGPRDRDSARGWLRIGGR